VIHLHLSLVLDYNTRITGTDAFDDVHDIASSISTLQGGCIMRTRGVLQLILYARLHFRLLRSHVWSTVFSYLISPRTCHRFVGHLEEEAVRT
jgi:hypothetical protein